MEMRAAVAEFMYSRDLSSASKLWYRARLGEFAEWLASQDVREVEAISPQHVRAYLAYVHDRPTPKGTPRDSHTLHGYARALRAFLRWAASEELVVPSLPKKVV